MTAPFALGDEVRLASVNTHPFPYVPVDTIGTVIEDKRGVIAALGQEAVVVRVEFPGHRPGTTLGQYVHVDNLAAAS